MVIIFNKMTLSTLESSLFHRKRSFSSGKAWKRVQRSRVRDGRDAPREAVTLPVVLTNHASRQVNKQKKSKWRAWLAIRMNFKQNRVKKGQNRDKNGQNE